MEIVIVSSYNVRASRSVRVTNVLLTLLLTAQTATAKLQSYKASSHPGYRLWTGVGDGDGKNLSMPEVKKKKASL